MRKLMLTLLFALIIGLPISLSTPPALARANSEGGHPELSGECLRAYLSSNPLNGYSFKAKFPWSGAVFALGVGRGGQQFCGWAYNNSYVGLSEADRVRLGISQGRFTPQDAERLAVYLCNKQSGGSVRCQVYAVGKKVVWQSARSSGSALVTSPPPASAPPQAIASTGDQVNSPQRPSTTRYAAVPTTVPTSTAPATPPSTPARADLASTCKGLGYVEGTSGFDICVSRLEELKLSARVQPPVARPPSPAVSSPSAARSASAAPATKPRAAPPLRPAPTPQYTETDPDALTCERYGYDRGKPGFADCMMQLDMARKALEQADAQYARDKALYQEQLAAAEKERRRQLGLRQLEMGLGLLAGGGVRQPGATPSAPLAPPPPPTTRTIRLPNGSQILCQTIGSYTSCR
jgi:hypothetical protein